VPPLAYRPEAMRPRRITPLGELSCPAYCRITAEDKPGVLAAIASVFAAHGISLESVLQKGRKVSGSVPIVLRTHAAREADLSAALAKIDALDVVTAPTVKIRILDDQEQDR